MKIKENNPLEIKFKTSVKGLTATHQSWSTVQNKEDATRIIDKQIEHMMQKHVELEDFENNKDRWREIIRSRVYDKEWGKKRTFDRIQEFFELEDEEKEWMEREILIFRTMRLEERTREEAIEYLARNNKIYTTHPNQQTLK